jgi:hypothetical protein
VQAITYVGPGHGKIVRMKGRIYDFEWRKSVGIGNRKDEVELAHAKKLASWKDKRGKKIFILE